MNQHHVQLLMTGNELMSGDVIDSNSAMIAQALKDKGIELIRKVTVADNLPHLVEEIQTISKQAKVLIINGGLGPTVDDLTAQALAMAANIPLTMHPEALGHLEVWCKQRGVVLNEPNKKQALLPQNCQIIANSVGSAVGFELQLNGCKIYCTPGVPSELKVMLEQVLIEKLSMKLALKNKTDITRLQVFGLGESSLQQLIDEHLPDWPAEIELGFRATRPQIEIKLTSRSDNAATLKRQWLAKLHLLLGDHIIGENDSNLPECVLSLLTQKHATITIAESCTGGLIASQLTQISGSSQAFEAGFVTYSNRIKSKLLSVDPAIIDKHGAVSKATVIAMAQGALTVSEADYVIAVSGIAGPDGGSIEKPVGMVWLGWGDADNIQTTCLYLPGNRHYVQHYAAAAGLDLIRRVLLNSDDEPYYLQERKFRST